MPPSTYSSQDQSQSETLSNEDIELLWQIILKAQRSPTVDKLPFRALFQAYDAILSQYGIDPSHDQIYFRFLFRLGSEKKQGQTLLEVFEALLAELGIKIVVDGQEDGADGTIISRPESIVDEEVEEQENTEQFTPRPRTRRASFSSVIGAEEETTKLGRQRDVSRASTSRVLSQAERARKQRPITNSTTKSPAKIAQRRPSSLASPKSRSRRLTSLGNADLPHDIPWKDGSQAGSRGRPRDHDRRQLPISSRAPSELRSIGDSESRLGSLADDDLSSVLSDARPSQAIVHPQDLHRPSDTQLVRDSDMLIQRDRQHLEFIAASRDRETLLRQSFELWRNKRIVKQQAMETKRFFTQLEQQAIRARNLYLLAKAFTHWAQSASEHVQQTSAARQHVLRLRYFNAWREITAVNELKVRRARLKKFLIIWKRQYVANFHTETRAIIVYRGNLAKEIYWRWFWAFCNERAPVWRAQRLRKKYFDKWRQSRTAIILREQTVTQTRRLSLEKNPFTVWKEKRLILASLASQMANHYRQRLLTQTFSQWRSRLTYEPRARQVSSMADWRIAATTFALLRRRATLERQATLVSRMRIMRNAWTTWNDKLRSQALGQLINERVMLQALYVWVLRERYRLLFRLTQKRLVQRCLHKLQSRHRAILAQRKSAAIQVQATQKRNLLSVALQHWHNRTHSNLQTQQVALDFARPRATSKALSLLSVKHAQTQKLETWATDFAYYFRATRTLKKWQDAVAASRRENRRSAYAQMRRRVKISLVRRALLYWHDRTAQLGVLQVQAEESRERILIKTATSLFTHWSSRTQTVLTTHDQISQQSTLRLISNTLHTWRELLKERQMTEQKSRVFASLHVSKLAYDSLRIMHLKVLDLSSRREVAGTVREWNQKRAVRGLLGVWAEKAARRKASRAEGEDVERASSESVLQGKEVLGAYTPYRGSRANPRFETGALTATRRVPGTLFAPRDGTLFGTASTVSAAFEPAAASDQLAAFVPTMQQEDALRASIPAYLSTPSKRANRTRALVERAGSTTPAETPASGGLFGTRGERGGGRGREEGRRREEDLRVSVLGRSVIGRRP